MTAKDCKFYLKGGKCSHKNAPSPCHSWCIGKDNCNDYIPQGNVTNVKRIIK